jgi:hypothetical protein
MFPVQSEQLHEKGRQLFRRNILLVETGEPRSRGTSAYINMVAIGAFPDQTNFGDWWAGTGVWTSRHSHHHGLIAESTFF